MEYTSKAHILWDEIQIIPSSFIPIKTTATIKTLNLRKLETYHFENRKSINVLRSKSQQQQQFFLGSTASITIVIIIIIILYWKQHTLPEESPDAATTESADAATTVSPVSAPVPQSRGGGVTYPDTYP